MSENHFLFDAVRHYAETRAAQAALIFGDRVITYGDLQCRVNRVANGLASLNLTPTTLCSGSAIDRP